MTNKVIMSAYERATLQIVMAKDEDEQLTQREIDVLVKAMKIINEA